MGTGGGLGTATDSLATVTAVMRGAVCNLQREIAWSLPLKNEIMSSNFLLFADDLRGNNILKDEHSLIWVNVKYYRKKSAMIL